MATQAPVIGTNGNGEMNENGNENLTVTEKVDDTAVDMNISMSEISKGGLKYEVIIQESAKVVTPPRGPSPALNSKPVISAELIQLKIEAASERRQSLEAERLSALAIKLRKVEEVSKKIKEEKVNLINSTKENLEQNMKVHIENRETRIADLKTKLNHVNNQHNGRLQEVKQNFEASITELKQELETKLEIVGKNREKAIQQKIESLKKHDEKVEMIRKRNSMTERNVQTDED